MSCQDNNNSSSSRREKFRTSIRRQERFNHLSVLRQKIMTENDIKVLNELLYQLDQQSSGTSQMKQILAILDNQITNINFTEKINESKDIQYGFANIILNHCGTLSLQEKSSLLSAFDYFTFYAKQQPMVFKQKSEFLDCLMNEIGALKFEETNQIIFLDRIVTLFMNLSSDIKTESDIAKNIVQLISSTNNHAKHIQSQKYQNALYDVRLSVIKLFKNIVKSLITYQQLILKLVVSLLQDQKYFQCYPGMMLLLLAEGMQNKNFYGELFEKEETAQQQIMNTIIFIMSPCEDKKWIQDQEATLTKQHTEDIKCLLLFFIELFYQDNQDSKNVYSWQLAIQYHFNGFMLAQFLKIAYNNNTKQDLFVGLKMYHVLSESHFVTPQQLLIVRPREDYYTLLKIWTDLKLLLCPNLGSYCLKILTNLLRGNKRYHKQLMELGIADSMREVFDIFDKNEVINVLEVSIQFCQALLSSDDGREGRLLGYMDNKGLIKRVDRLVDHRSVKVYQKAELFMELVRQESARHSDIV